MNHEYIRLKRTDYKFNLIIVLFLFVSFSWRKTFEKYFLFWDRLPDPNGKNIRLERTDHNFAFSNCTCHLNCHCFHHLHLRYHLSLLLSFVTEPWFTGFSSSALDRLSRGRYYYLMWQDLDLWVLLLCIRTARFTRGFMIKAIAFAFATTCSNTSL